MRIYDMPEFRVKDTSNDILIQTSTAVLEDHDGIVLDVAVSEEIDGAYYLASVGNDYMLNVYDVTRRGSRIASLHQAHKGVISCVTFGHGPAADRIYTGSWDRTICVRDLKGREIKVLKKHKERITDLCVSGDGRYVGVQMSCNV